MSDLKKKLDYLLNSKSLDYNVGFNDCKQKVLKIIKKYTRGDDQTQADYILEDIEKIGK